MNQYTYGFTPKGAGYTVYATKTSASERKPRPKSSDGLGTQLLLALLFGGSKRYPRRRRYY